MSKGWNVVEGSPLCIQAYENPSHLHILQSRRCALVSSLFLLLRRALLGALSPVTDMYIHDGHTRTKSECHSTSFSVVNYSCRLGEIQTYALFSILTAGVVIAQVSLKSGRMSPLLPAMQISLLYQFENSGADLSTW